MPFSNLAKPKQCEIARKHKDDQNALGSEHANKKRKSVKLFYMAQLYSGIGRRDLDLDFLYSLILTKLFCLDGLNQHHNRHG